MTFATDIRALRLARGLNQREAARLLALTAQTVNNWERGRNQPWPHVAARARAVLETGRGEGHSIQLGSGERPARRNILADCLA
jgi:transcriptional regulator with XRE-family HTH domain